eukprot:CAMPEP_0194283208 /NCGR_PEP_ID=MMETSP0169-20130528/24871_1 /TAXON_ID=218684 /ORGANISM="Corethron pennatum, Strain L29A3" /LENGTH=361 /DNA_ID=CAMNT_0039028757 /DNA_START=184 /DNA_END=1269 /DNA_ORIENTATION=-
MTVDLVTSDADSNTDAYFTDHFFNRGGHIHTTGLDNYTDNTSAGGGGQKPNAVVYGLLHMAKTGGTTINGELAMRHERVCGNKGFSHDFNAINTFLKGKRDARIALKQERDRRELYNNSTHLKVNRNYNVTNAFLVEKRDARIPLKQEKGRRVLYNNDARRKVNRKEEGFTNHGHYVPALMVEVGFQDCDYVANEIGAKFWAHTFGEWHRPLELHVPCRDPVDLLLSMCNYQKIEFTCKSNFKEEIDLCFGKENQRFDTELLTHPNIHLKCFRSPHSLVKYLDYMGERLEKKEIIDEYVPRDSNKPRQRSEECLSKQDYLYRMEIVKYLKKSTVYMEKYFQFCEKCLKSDDNLFGNIYKTS